MNAGLGDPIHGFDDLHIIAKDADSRLDRATRAIIVSAADDFEATNRALVVTHCELIEAKRKIAALNDQLMEVKKRLPPLTLSLSSGWIPLTGYNHPIIPK